MAEVKPLVLNTDGTLRQFNVATDTLPDASAHANDLTIHNKVYIQSTEPVSWNDGDIWMNEV